MTTRSVGGVGSGSPQLDSVLSSGATTTTLVLPQGSAPKPRETGGVGGNTVVTAPPPAPRGSSATPAEVPTGTMDYYRQRLNDFLARNPGAQPPPYYLEYGDRYIRAFSTLDRKDLSQAGLEWRDRARKNLQDAIETRSKKQGFAELERDHEAFKDFAFKTHAKAYLNAGLLNLPLQDLLTIVTVPDLKDLLTPAGLNQILTVVQMVRPNDFDTILRATTTETGRALDRMKEELLHPFEAGFAGMMKPAGG